VSEEPVEVVREQFEATNAREFERAMDLYADDVVLVVAESWGIGSGTYRGKVAVGEWFGDWFRQFAHDYRFEIREARELGQGGVFLVAHHTGTGRASGAPIGSVSGYLYRVKEGKIVRAELFHTADEALEAASLPEWSDPQTH
jgi:ketosteroid isomerase-like protein